LAAASIALIGLPGCGKSTVGKHLAHRIDWQFVDSDALIEQHVGCPIKAFFAQKGQDVFRAIESQVIAQSVLQPDTVLATGGGAVLVAANRELLHQHCQVVYLRAAPDQLYKRLRRDTQRPLLQVADPLAKLHELYAQRDPLYLQTAHHVIEPMAPSVSVLLRAILEALGKKK
jgi:shikimate kinase